MEKKNDVLNIRDIALIAILSALATVAYYLLEVPIIPFAPNLKVNFADIPSIIGALTISPVAGLLILVIRCAMHLFKSGTAGIGEIMDIIVGTSILIPFIKVYAKTKERFSPVASYVFAAVAGIIGAIIGGLIGNLIFYPIFMYLIVGAGIESTAVLITYLGGTVIANLVRSVITFIGCLPFLPLIAQFKKIINQHR